MIELNSELAVYLYCGVADMRHGIDRLAEKIRSELKRTPITGGLYVFFSRCRRRVRIIYWERDGYCIWSKRLEAGLFKVELVDGYEELTGINLKELLNGIELSRIKLRQNAEKGLYS